MSQNESKCLTKTNLLVYQQPQGEKEKRPCRHRKPPAYSAIICRVPPKIIKICTGAELKKMCPPPCDCKAMKSKNLGGKGAFGFLLWGLKAAVAATLIYVSYDMGIWGTTDDTQEIYRRYCTATTIPRKRNDKWDPPSCEAQKDLFAAKVFKPYGHCDDPPFNPNRSFHKFQNKWNHGVECVFGALAGFPGNVINLLSTSENTETVTHSDEQPRCIPYSELPEEQKIIPTYK